MIPDSTEIRELKRLDMTRSTITILVDKLPEEEITIVTTVKAREAAQLPELFKET